MNVIFLLLNIVNQECNKKSFKSIKSPKSRRRRCLILPNIALDEYRWTMDVIPSINKKIINIILQF